MARARTKDELLQYSEKEKATLLHQLEIIRQQKLENKPVFDNRKPKDIVAHLIAWQKLMDTWYTEGMANKKPDIPAPGYRFETAPELNEKLFQEYKLISLEQILTEFEKTHALMMKHIANHTDSDHFTKKKYAWTGSTSMGAYFASATSSHYLWANTLLKKFIKSHTN